MKRRVLSILIALSIVLCGLSSFTFVSAAPGEAFNVTVNAADGGKVSTGGESWSDSVVLSVAKDETIGDKVECKPDEGYKIDGVIANVIIKKVVASSLNTAVIDEDGNLYTAGDNYRGQLGRKLGSYKYEDSVLTKISTSAKITDIAAGAEHTVILDENGDVWTAGSNQYGALGTDVNVGKSYGENSSFTKVTVGDGSVKIKAIAAGQKHTILIDINGGVWTAGLNSDGELGRSDNVGRDKPNAVFKKAEGLENVKIISAAGGTAHTILLDEDGNVWTAGTSYYGVLGRQTQGDPNKVTANPLFEKVTDGISDVKITAIAAGSYHNALLAKDGSIWTVGSNLYGELGRETGETSDGVFGKADLQGAAAAKFVAAAGSATVVIDTDGNARTCGINSGHLGRTVTKSYNPELFVAANGIDNTKMAAAAMGLYHTVLLDENGRIWTCGKNQCGQLCRTEGFGKYTSITSFAAVTDSMTQKITFDAMKNTRITSNRAYTVLFAERERVGLEYILDGGEWVNGFAPRDFAYKDEALSLPDASRIKKTGYVFKEWEVPSLTTDPVKCYAKWEERADFTVRFDTNGGTDIADTTNVRWTDKVLEGVAALTKAGYDFAGWKLGDRDVTAGDTYADLAIDDAKASITLTAQWTVNQYTITVKPENGEEDIAITEDYGTPITAPVLTRTGYNFAGWDKDFPTTMPAENMTVTAKWVLCDHDGSTTQPTCTASAVCSRCGGTLAALGHVPKPGYKSDENSHWMECGRCTDKLNEEPHSDADKDHVCDICDRVISNHEDVNKDHVCDYCGKTISNHEDVNKDHVCDYCGKVISEHTGGEATCIEKAICEICGESYGELDPNNHSDLVHVSAKAATKDAEGNIEYWYCNGCGKYFGDAAAAKEINKADTVIKKSADDKKPRTGDNGNMTLWLALIIISGVALTGAIIVGRKRMQFKK